MYCENCGAKNAEKNMFCAKCGHKMVQEEVKEIKEEAKKKEIVEEKSVPIVIKEGVDTGLQFEKSKYISYILKIQRSVTMTYVYWFFIGLMFSLMILSVSTFQEKASSISSSSSGSNGMMILAIIPPIVGLIIAHARTLEKKIRVQEMKWRLDFYTKHIK